MDVDFEQLAALFQQQQKETKKKIPAKVEFGIAAFAFVTAVSVFRAYGSVLTSL